MQIKYYGHSCFSIEIDNKILLFDPFITPNPKAKDININDINPDYILVSHGHFDHVADLENIAKRSNATLIANYEIVTHYQKLGIENGHPMNTGGKWKFDFGTVTMTNAVHSSSFEDGSYAGTAGGFVISSEECTFYYAGDTDFFSDMERLGRKFDLDLCFLPVGGNFTMGIEDAIEAAEALKVKKIIAMHFDTFPYIEILKDESISLATKNSKELILPEIGKTVNV